MFRDGLVRIRVEEARVHAIEAAGSDGIACAVFEVAYQTDIAGRGLQNQIILSVRAGVICAGVVRCHKNHSFILFCSQAL